MIRSLKIILMTPVLMALWMPSCRKDSGSAVKTSAPSSPKAESGANGNKMTISQINDEKELIMGWLRGRRDLTRYHAILSSASSVFPMLYDDSRLRISFFVPDDKSFDLLPPEQLNKISNGTPDDFELALFNSSIVRTIDFNWSGASSLSGQTLNISADGRTISFNGRSYPVSEVRNISSHTRIYVVSGLLK